ncbi:hypothetical protein, partial [Lentimonas sp. CC19]
AKPFRPHPPRPYAQSRNRFADSATLNSNTPIVADWRSHFDHINLYPTHKAETASRVPLNSTAIHPL